MRLILPLLLCLSALPASAAKHAFVLANNAYEQLSSLRNTHADAEAYGGAFEELGFDVTHHRDLTRAETLGAFDAFLNRVRPGDQVAFVYSGHGWSDGQGNYLVPTDAPKQGSDRRLRGQSLALRNGVNGVLDELEALGAGLTVAVIDACRDNPFKPPEGRRSAGLSRGLARVSPPQGTFVIFSAGEGQQALDRLPDDPPDQRLSVFSRVFVPNLTSGVTLEDAISTTQAEVASLALRFDGHQQHPAYYDQTLGKTCLKGDCAPQTGRTPLRSRTSRTRWQPTRATRPAATGPLISDLSDHDVIEAFLSAYPDCVLMAAIARSKLAGLADSATPPPAPTPAPERSPQRPLIAQDECALQVASFYDRGELANYMATLPDFAHRNLRIYEGANGWFGVTLQTVKASTKDFALDQVRSQLALPQDAFCNPGDSYVAQVEWTDLRATRDILKINDPKDSWLNFRTGPGTSQNDIIRRLNNGTLVQVVRRAGRWAEVETTARERGWVFEKHTKRVDR